METQKRKGIGHLPSGSTKYLETLKECLTYVRDNSPNRGQLMQWFLDSFPEVHSKRSSLGYVYVIEKQLGLLAEEERGHLVLSAQGKAFAERFDPNVFLKIFTNQIDGVLDIFAILNNKPCSFREIDSFLRTRFGWRKSIQTSIRLYFLCSADLVIRMGKMYALTDDGKKALEALPLVPKIELVQPANETLQPAFTEDVPSPWRDEMRDMGSRFFSQSVFDLVFPVGCELLPSTHEVFAIEFALGELKTLSREKLIKRSGFFARIDYEPTLHFRLCQETPIEEIRSGKTVWVKSFFEANRFSTGYATHSLFPYRGKFHPQLIKGILNVIGVDEGETILDPMAGSGTACIEAQLMNINAIGIDISPFCTLISRAKSYALDVDVNKLEKWAAEKEVLEAIKNLPSHAKKCDNTDSYFSDIDITGDQQIDLIILLAYLDAVGYSRRRKTGSVESLFPKVLRRYLQTIRSFSETRDRLEIKLGRAVAHTGDVLNLSIPDNSVDAIVTSPPYSFAIDYVENDRPQLEFLGVDVDKLKTDMIGLQGKTRMEQVRNYFQTMDKAIDEMSQVLKSGRFCVIIVGSNEIQTGGIRHERKFFDFAKNHKLLLRRDLVKSIAGIQNSMREEHVLFFQKE